MYPASLYRPILTFFDRKVRVQNYQKANFRRKQRNSSKQQDPFTSDAVDTTTATTRQSKRAAVAQIKDTEELRALLAERDEQIEAMCLLLKHNP
jgi:16S rRNA U1498 N3-methylase RsmE